MDEGRVMPIAGEAARGTDALQRATEGEDGRCDGAEHATVCGPRGQCCGWHRLQVVRFDHLRVVRTLSSCAHMGICARTADGSLARRT